MEDRKNDDIITYITRIEEESTSYKSEQKIAGDGWIVYRKKYTTNLNANSLYKVTYNLPDQSLRSLTTVYAFTELVQEIDEPNTWYFKSGINPATDFVIYLYSVKNGTISVQQV